MPRSSGSSGSARRVALLVAAVTVCYLGLVGWQGIRLLGAGSWPARGLGFGVLLLPVVGLFVVVRELRFGHETERLARLLANGPAGGDPDDSADLTPARRPSGRMDRIAADAVFARRRAEVEQDPEDWRRWYRLAVAYGDAGDTRRGRVAMRHAIALERRAASGPAPGGERPGP